MLAKLRKRKEKQKKRSVLDQGGLVQTSRFRRRQRRWATEGGAAKPAPRAPRAPPPTPGTTFHRRRPASRAASRQLLEGRREHPARRGLRSCRPAPWQLFPGTSHPTARHTDIHHKHNSVAIYVTLTHPNAATAHIAGTPSTALGGSPGCSVLYFKR